MNTWRQNASKVLSIRLIFIFHKTFALENASHHEKAEILNFLARLIMTWFIKMVIQRTQNAKPTSLLTNDASQSRTLHVLSLSDNRTEKICHIKKRVTPSWSSKREEQTLQFSWPDLQFLTKYNCWRETNNSTYFDVRWSNSIAVIYPTFCTPLRTLFLSDVSPFISLWFILSISFLCVSLKSFGSSELMFFYKTIYEVLLSGYLKILTGYSHRPSTSE